MKILESHFKSLFVLLLMALSITGVRAGEVVPAGISFYDYAYENLNREGILSPDFFDYQLGSYNLEEFLSYNYKYNIPVHKDRDHLMFFNIIEEKISTEKNSSPIGREYFRAGFSGKPNEKIYFYANILLDESKALDSSYTGKKWRGLAGGVESGFINYNTDIFDFTFGRFASFWGNKNSLVLSARNSMDGFAYTWKWGRLRLSYRLARLDNIASPENSTLTENRYFAAHRLDIHFKKNLRVGLFETAVFGGVGRQIELGYLNPIIFYHSTQLNEGTDDNTFLGFDFDFQPADRFSFYGQFMVDDLQIDNSSNGDREPAQYGIQFGTIWVNMLNRLDFSAEYSRVTNWTYNQAGQKNRYLFHNEPIGGLFGNDYDYLQLSFVKHPKNKRVLRSSLNFSFVRQGEGSVTADWAAPWLALNSGDYKEKFPTGVVQSTTAAYFGLKYLIFNNISVHTKAGFRSVKNLQNISGNKQEIPFVNILFASYFSTNINIK